MSRPLLAQTLILAAKDALLSMCFALYEALHRCNCFTLYMCASARLRRRTSWTWRVLCPHVSTASQQCRPDVHHFSAYDLRADQQRVSKRQGEVQGVAVCRPAALDADASMTGRSWASCP